MMHLCPKGIEFIHYLTKLVREFGKHNCHCPKCEEYQVEVVVRRKHDSKTTIPVARATRINSLAERAAPACLDSNGDAVQVRDGSAAVPATIPKGEA